MHVATAFDAMIEAALWSSTDQDGEPLEINFAPWDVAEGTREELRSELADFMEDSAEDIAASGLSDEQVGFDFWLTRNGHGAGFWDRGLGEVGERLTAAAKVWTGIDLEIGDDGLLHAL